MAVTREEAVKRDRVNQMEYRAEQRAASRPVQRRALLTNSTGVAPRKPTQTPARRAATPQRRSRGRTLPRSPVAAYSRANPRTGGGHIGTLEAEFFGCMVLIAITIFTDPKASSDYASVMLAAMKRGTCIIILFFILALLASAGDNAARVAKAFGALVVVGLILAQAESGLFKQLDSFFVSNWTSGGATGGTGSSANAEAGNPSPAPGKSTIQQIQDALNNLGQALTGGGIGSAALGALSKLKGLL